MTDARTDIDAAAELAAEPAVYPVEPGDRFGVALPPGWTFDTYDEERSLGRPWRAAGTVVVHDAASFVAAVMYRELPADTPVVYADEDRLALVAVLNDDDSEAAGWRDYRVELGLRETPEWRHWAGADGKLLNQEAFAEHIEDGVAELRSPPAATMLDVAQTIHGTVTANFKSGRRLASGEVQFAYEEEATAGAGKGGDLTIPDTLVLALRPFVGGTAYELTARFRYRLPTRGEPHLRLGYKLDRPHEVKRAAFNDIRSQVAEGLPDSPFIAGPAPAAR